MNKNVHLQKVAPRRRRQLVPLLCLAGLAMYATVQALTLSAKTKNTDNGEYYDIAAISLQYSEGAYAVCTVGNPTLDASGHRDVLFGYHTSGVVNLLPLGDIPGGEHYTDNTGTTLISLGGDHAAAVDGVNYDGHHYGVACGKTFQGLVDSDYTDGSVDVGDSKHDILTLLSVDGNAVDVGSLSPRGEGIDVYDSAGTPKGDDTAYDICMGVMTFDGVTAPWAWVVGNSSNGGMTVIGYQVEPSGSTFKLKRKFVVKNYTATEGSDTFSNRIGRRIYYKPGTSSGGTLYIVGQADVNSRTSFYVCKVNAPSGTYQKQAIHDFGVTSVAESAVIIPTDGSIVLAGYVENSNRDTGVAQFSGSLAALGTPQTFDSITTGNNPTTSLNKGTIARQMVDIAYLGLNSSGDPQVVVGTDGPGSSSTDMYFAAYPVSPLGTRKYLQGYNGASGTNDVFYGIEADSTLSPAPIYLTGTRDPIGQSSYAITAEFDDGASSPTFVTEYAENQHPYGAIAYCSTFLNNTLTPGSDFLFMGGFNYDVQSTTADAPGAVVWRIIP